jgi:hypothetical protein
MKVKGFPEAATTGTYQQTYEKLCPSAAFGNQIYVATSDLAETLS